MIINLTIGERPNKKNIGSLDLTQYFKSFDVETLFYSNFLGVSKLKN